jgi:catechol 2,3-dioxygenase-like lactoylglutathione lyase family enzyme
MQIKKLDHVNVQTTQLEEMVNWYRQVLSLPTGPRPNFSFPGAWLYVGDGAAIHLVAHDGPPGAGSETALKIEHYAFQASGLKEFEVHLKQIGEPYRRVDLAAANLVQINLWDPDGNHIHIDFQDED